MIETIVRWLETENCFPWFTGTGFNFVFCCVVLGFCAAVCISKKVREKFF